MNLSTRVVLIRASVVVWLEHRRLRSQLRRELGTYVTQAERNDLLAAFDRYPDAATNDYREIMARSSARDRFGRWPAMGPR
jgi:hypothetical protein